jgi:hypothetical protein
MLRLDCFVSLLATSLAVQATARSSKQPARFVRNIIVS